MAYTLEVIDRLTEQFTTYIDSGFGLLQPDVAYLTTVLVTIDIVLAGLFRALNNDQYMPVTLIQKTLYIGFFAFILNNFREIANIIYMSFAELGLKAGQASFTPDKLLKPAFIAETGLNTGGTLIWEAGNLFFSWSFDSTKGAALILLPAGIFVIVAFLILATHLFVTIIEFKITTLLGFILVPFALFGKTSFLADRVLNHVINSGLKLMVLGIITAIGSSFFATLKLSKNTISLEEASAAVLAALAILTLSFSITRLTQGFIFGTPGLDTTPVKQTQQVALNTAYVAGKTVTTPIRAATSMGSWVMTRRAKSAADSEQAPSSTSSTETASDLNSSPTHKNGNKD